MEFINDILNQITNLSTGAMLVVSTIVAGYLIKAVPVIPNQSIPMVTFLVAVTGNILLGDMGAVSPTTRYPEVRLGFAGMAYWGVGWLIHNQGLSRLEKLLPAPLRALLGVSDKPITPEELAGKAKEDK